MNGFGKLCHPHVIYFHFSLSFIHVDGRLCQRQPRRRALSQDGLTAKHFPSDSNQALWREMVTFFCFLFVVYSCFSPFFLCSSAFSRFVFRMFRFSNANERLLVRLEYCYPQNVSAARRFLCVAVSLSLVFSLTPF